MLKKETEPRIGDKVKIPGAYQYNAYYCGNKVQRFWHQAKLQEAEEALCVKPGDSILDAGCGSGLLAFFLASKYKATVIGLDINEEALNFCRIRYHLPNLRFERGLVTDPSFTESTFDKIVMLEVIEHLTRDQGHQIFTHFNRLLKPGGILVISTPNKNSAWPVIEWLLDKLRLTPPITGEQHEYLYTQKELSKIGIETGFKIINEKTINGCAPWISVLNNRFAWFLHDRAITNKSRYGSLLLTVFQK